MERFKALFIEKFQSDIRAIEDIMALPERWSEDWKELLRIFHNIKSDAAMMMYSSISREALEVETLLSEASPGDYHALEGRVREALGRFRDELRMLRG